MNPERRTLVYLALIFLSGLLLGATVMNYAEHNWLHGETANEYDISRHQLIARLMSQRLHLSAAQETQVNGILQQTLGQYQRLELRLAPQFDQVRQVNRNRLRAILTPAQRTKFNHIVGEVDARYPLNERPAVLAPASGPGSPAPGQ